MPPPHGKPYLDKPEPSDFLMGDHWMMWKSVAGQWIHFCDIIDMIDQTHVNHDGWDGEIVQK